MSKRRKSQKKDVRLIEILGKRFNLNTPSGFSAAENHVQFTIDDAVSDLVSAGMRFQEARMEEFMLEIVKEGGFNE